MQNITDRLRPLVGLNGWDYCVYWKLSEDQRSLEWMGCCCAGTSNAGDQEQLFPVAVSCSCRDTLFPHPTTNSCLLLSQLPPSIPIDSGIYAETLLSNQSNWAYFSNSSDSNILDETIGTQVLIPLPGGLVELLVTKQVPEDPQVIDLVKSQCTVLVEQGQAMNNIGFNIDMNVNSIKHMQSNAFLGDDDDEGKSHNDHFHPSPTTVSETPHDISPDHIRLCNSSLNLMQQFNYNSQQQNRSVKNDVSLEKSQGAFLMEKQDEKGLQTYQKCMITTDTQYVENNELQQQAGMAGRSDSVSDCSDPNDDEDDAKYRRRNGKGNQSKNLVAERKRRKKLNDRLYNLRSLVPRISKLDRASILGDAIEFVKDLQKQVKELQEELENSDTGGESNSISGKHAAVQPDHVILCQNGESTVKTQKGYVSKQKQELDTTCSDKQTQQMEPQVEVALIDGNEFFVKVFCEHRPGGFGRLMEAFDSLGIEVIHATVTSHKGLVSNVFKVEKKDNEIIEAEDVKDSLLELTRNPRGEWTNMATASDNGVGNGSKDYQHQLHNYNQLRHIHS